MIKLLSLYIKNFMSFKEASIDFDKYDKPLLFIGDNGVGKSSIMEAINICIYGKSIRKSTAKSYVNRKVKKDCLIRIVLKKDSEDNILKITRYKKHHKYGDSIYIRHNDKSIKYRKQKDAQEFINRWLGIDYRLFSNTSIFGQGRNKFFSSVEESERKDIIESVFNLSKYDFYYDVAKRKVNFYSSRCTELKYRKDELLRRIGKFKVIFEDYKNKSIDELNKELNINIKRKEAYREKIDKVDNDIDLLNSKVKVTYDDLDKQKNMINIVVSRLMNKSKEIKDIESKISLYKKWFNRPELVIKEGSICPTCKRLVDKKALPIFMEWIKSELNDNIVELKNINSSYAIDLKKKEALSSDLFVLKDKYDENVEKIYSLKSILSSLKGRISVCNDNIESTKEQIKKVKEGKGNIKAITSTIEQTHAEIASLELFENKTRKYYDSYKILQEAFGDKGIKNYVLRDIMPELNSIVFGYAERISGGSIEGLRISPNTELGSKEGELRDKFSVHVKIDGHWGSFNDSSWGEERIIDTSIMLAFRDLSTMAANQSFGLLLADEIFDTLAMPAISNVIDLLNEMSEDGDNVVVISHNEELVDLFENVLRIKKDKYGSFIEEVA